MRTLIAVLAATSLGSMLGGFLVPATPAFGQGIITAPPAAAREEGVIKSAQAVLTEAVATPDRGIPNSMLKKAEAVVIVPRLLKIGIIAGVRHGQGVLVVKNDDGIWQLPQFISLTGGSIGWQAGIVSSDLVLVFTNRRRVEQLLKNGRFTIGVDAAAAAGPVGRTVAAGTDGTLSAEIYSYARSRGLFAGVSVDGAVIQIDHFANQRFYVGGSVPNSAMQLTTYIAQLTGGKIGVPAGQPAAQPAAPPAGAALAAPPVGSRVVSPRDQLVQAHRQLQRLLDPSWQRYLALPESLTKAGADPRTELQQLQQTLTRYDVVARDGRYATLTQRPEFQKAHTSLRGYVAALQSQTPATINLPPPPSAQP